MLCTHFIGHLKKCILKSQDSNIVHNIVKIFSKILIPGILFPLSIFSRIIIHFLLQSQDEIQNIAISIMDTLLDLYDLKNRFASGSLLFDISLIFTEFAKNGFYLIFLPPWG